MKILSPLEIEWHIVNNLILNSYYNSELPSAFKDIPGVIAAQVENETLKILFCSGDQLMLLPYYWPEIFRWVTNPL